MNRIIFSLLFSLFIPSLYAENLIQVYHQALRSDPTFKKAEADWLAAEMALPIARSGYGSPGSGLYPYIDLTGQLDTEYITQKTLSISSKGGVASYNYNIQLTQPIFNYATWKAISGANFSVKAATASYLSAAQDLMYRVSQAYFNVLRAYDLLQYTIAQKNSFYQQRVTTQQKYKVGLIPITGVYEAEASFDAAAAQEIQNRNDLINRLEDLRAITGKRYDTLSGLRVKIPLVIPVPADINAWVLTADRQNYSIQSSLYNMLSARENVKKVAAGAYPTITGTVSYGGTRTGIIPFLSFAIPGHGGAIAPFTETTAEAALNLNFPAYQGGYVSKAARQATYQYLSYADQLEFTHRNVDRLTRQSFNNVESGIYKIRADQKSIISAQSKLESTQAGYLVGTRTMVDILDAVTNLYQADEQWADDRYTYIINIVSLKQQAGTLSPADLTHINAWLEKSIHFIVKSKNSSKKEKTMNQPFKKTSSDLDAMRENVLKNAVEVLSVDKTPAILLMDHFQSDEGGSKNKILPDPRMTEVDLKLPLPAETNVMESIRLPIPN